MTGMDSAPLVGRAGRMRTHLPPRQRSGLKAEGSLMFLDSVEAGDIALIGATTENPSFEVNAALLSRSKVFILKPLDEAALVRILRRAMTDREHGLGEQAPVADDEVLGAMARYANGDARVALNLLELAVATAAATGHA